MSQPCFAMHSVIGLVAFFAFRLQHRIRRNWHARYFRCFQPFSALNFTSHPWVQQDEEDGIDPSEEKGHDHAQRSRCLVTKLAALNGLVAVCYQESIKWPGNFAEIFYIADAEHAKSYLDSSQCPFTS
mmetsp:Transcript_34733/g.54250  ORF Transcript_34733/g.54250 Transcript_34733/m.54250 type:complete len:128 (+) Transcript_34733:977-1360(+)